MSPFAIVALLGVLGIGGYVGYDVYQTYKNNAGGGLLTPTPAQQKTFNQVSTAEASSAEKYWNDFTGLF